jgi:uncharacterized membrane-anchored protein YhcB (DUF1043 family)
MHYKGDFEESPLLLAQLHQVQEELEKHFFDNEQLRETIAQQAATIEQALADSKALKTLLTEREKQVVALESRIQDQTHRQTLTDIEIATTKGQLELVKDLLRQRLPQ